MMYIFLDEDVGFPKNEYLSRSIAESGAKVYGDAFVSKKEPKVIGSDNSKPARLLREGF